MEYTRIKFTSYKESGGFIEERYYNSKIQPWDTDKILDYLYQKHPKLLKMNFTMEATRTGFFNGRLVLNALEN